MAESDRNEFDEMIEYAKGKRDRCTHGYPPGDCPACALYGSLIGGLRGITIKTPEG